MYQLGSVVHAFIARYSGNWDGVEHHLSLGVWVSLSSVARQSSSYLGDLEDLDLQDSQALVFPLLHPFLADLENDKHVHELIFIKALFLSNQL